MPRINPLSSPPGLLTLALLLAAHAAAQGQSAPAELTIQAALTGLSSAPAWRSAELAYLSASQSLDAARASAGLNLSASASYDVNRPENGSWSGGGSVGANASVTVLPWAPVNTQITSAQRALARAALTRRDSRNTLALNVAQQYFAAWLAGQDLTLAQAQLDLAGRQLQVAQAQRALGQASEETVLARQAEVQSAQATLDAARNSLALDLRQLSSTLGRSVEGLTLSSAPTAPAAPEALDALLARAQRARSEVLSAGSTLEDAQDAVRLAQFNRRVPDLSLSAKFGQIGSAQGSGAVVSAGLSLKSGAASLGVSTPVSSSNLPTATSLGVAGSFAILDPAGDADIRSKETAVQSAQLAVQTARDSVELDVRQKYTDLLAALDQLTSVQASVFRFQSALRTAQAREAAGLGTALDTGAAQVNLAQAQRTQVNAQQTTALASLRLANATGEFSISLLGGQP